MNSMIKSFLAFIGLIIFSGQLFAPIIVGNGGDPRILMFKKARIEAVNWTYKASLYPQFIKDDTQTIEVVKIFCSATAFSKRWPRIF